MFREPDSFLSFQQLLRLPISNIISWIHKNKLEKINEKIFGKVDQKPSLFRELLGSNYFPTFLFKYITSDTQSIEFCKYLCRHFILQCANDSHNFWNHAMNYKYEVHKIPHIILLIQGGLPVPPNIFQYIKDETSVKASNFGDLIQCLILCPEVVQHINDPIDNEGINFVTKYFTALSQEPISQLVAHGAIVDTNSENVKRQLNNLLFSALGPNNVFVFMELVRRKLVNISFSDSTPFELFSKFSGEKVEYILPAFILYFKKGGHIKYPRFLRSLISSYEEVPLRKAILKLLNNPKDMVFFLPMPLNTQRYSSHIFENFPSNILVRILEMSKTNNLRDLISFSLVSKTFHQRMQNDLDSIWLRVSPVYYISPKDRAVVAEIIK